MTNLNKCLVPMRENPRGHEHGVDFMGLAARTVDPKGAFLVYELGLLTIKAALSTRDAKNPIYAVGQSPYQRATALRAFRTVLAEIERKYARFKVSEAEHVKFISETATEVSKVLGAQLHCGRFRVGVTQKLVNLHLKYLWVAGFVTEPLHCPLDGIIRDRAGLSYDWTSNDSIADYSAAIAALQKVAGRKSLAVWELESFRRKAQ